MIGCKAWPCFHKLKESEKKAQVSNYLVFAHYIFTTGMFPALENCSVSTNREEYCKERGLLCPSKDIYQLKATTRLNFIRHTK